MINFTKIRYKNLLSSGNTFTNFDLDRSQTTLIVGDNGAGKSTLLDALCFVLYGKGFRNLKKDLLVNSINQKDLLVEIEFTVGRKSYKVIRGAKPNKFELYVNGTMLNQDATVRDYQEHLEKNILKMSFRSFTQVAVLGSANFTPFMQLKSVERRRLVEDLLDISIFSTMQDILKKKVTQHNIDVRETKHETELLEERISGLNEQMSLLQKNRDKKIAKYENTIQETQNNIDSVMKSIGVKQDEVKDKQRSISDRDPQGDRLKRALDVEKRLEDSQKKALKEIEFYQNNDDCPVCKQGLDEDHKTKCIKEKSDKVAELKAAVLSIGETIEASRNRMAEIQTVIGEIEEIQRKIGFCLLYTSPSPRDGLLSRMPSSA